MKKQITKTLIAMTLLLSVAVGGCSQSSSGGNSSAHEHSFENKIVEEQYAKEPASCAKPAQYYYSCECGAVGEKTFSVGVKLQHNYTAQVASNEYLKRTATCQKGAEYYLSCTHCGGGEKL